MMMLLFFFYNAPGLSHCFTFAFECQQSHLNGRINDTGLINYIFVRMGLRGFFYDTFAVAAAVAGRVLRVALVYCTDWCEIC